MSGLPEVMPAAVYQRPGEVGWRNARCPGPAPARCWSRSTTAASADRTSTSCSRAGASRDWSAGHEFTGTIVAAGRRGGRAGRLGETVVGGPSPSAGRCRRCLEGKPSQCEDRRARSSTATTAPSPATSGATRLAPAPARALGPRGRPGRAAGRGPPRHHPVGHGRRATRPWSSAPDPSAPSPSPPWWPGASARSSWSSPASGASSWPATSGPTEVLDPAELETFPPWEPERHLRPGPWTSCSSARARRRPWRPASTSCGGAAPWCWWGPGIEHPTFDPNRFILNELDVTGSFVYDPGGFEQALELLASGAVPDRPAHRARRRAARPASSTPWPAWPRAAIAGKVMVVPGLSEGAEAGPEGGPDDAPLLPVGQSPLQPRGHEPARRPPRREPTGPTSAGSGARSSASTRCRR